jgi:hypothetical protein
VNERQYRSLERYIRDCADRVGLRDWKITLDREPCENDDHLAAVHAVYVRMSANVKVNAHFDHIDPDEQRHVIAHELTHIHMEADYDFIEENVAGMIGGSAWAILEPTLRLLREQAVDGVAKGLAQALPYWQCPN